MGFWVGLGLTPHPYPSPAKRGNLLAPDGVGEVYTQIRRLYMQKRFSLLTELICQTDNTGVNTRGFRLLTEFNFN